MNYNNHSLRFNVDNLFATKSDNLFVANHDTAEIKLIENTEDLYLN